MPINILYTVEGKMWFIRCSYTWTFWFVI